MTSHNIHIPVTLVRFPGRSDIVMKSHASAVASGNVDIGLCNITVKSGT